MFAGDTMCAYPIMDGLRRRQAVFALCRPGLQPSADPSTAVVFSYRLIRKLMFVNVSVLDIVTLNANIET
jgi:hypothetical protein